MRALPVTDRLRLGLIFLLLVGLAGSVAGCVGLQGTPPPTLPLPSPGLPVTSDDTPITLEPTLPAQTRLSDVSPSPKLGPAATSSDTATPAQAVTRSPTPTPEPEPPPLLPAASGQPLTFSLQPLANVEVHLTAGAVTQLAGQTAFVFSSLDRMVYAYSAAGQKRWQARMGGPVYAIAVLEGGRLAAGDETGMVTVLDAAGQRLWQHSLGTRVTALAGSWQGGLLAGGWDERLTLFDLNPGNERVRWQVQLSERVTDIAALPGFAIVSTIDGAIRAFDASGVALWRYDAGAPVVRLTTSPIQAGDGRVKDLLLVGLQDGRLVALAPDGSLRWQVRLGDGSPVWHLATLQPQAAPVIVAATGGVTPTLSLLSAEGDWQWRLALPSPAGAVSTLDLDSDGQAEILAGLANGELVAYDRRGRRRASVQAGLPVWDLVPAGDGLASSGLVLADLFAWRVAVGAGTAIKPRLAVPSLLAAVPESLPRSAVPLAGGQAPRTGAVLAFLGDVVPGRSIELQIDRYGAGYPWAGLAPLLRDADLAMANLECVLSTQGKALNKPYVIRAHPGTAQTLAAGGLDLVSLANNHALDYGDAALDETLSALSARNIGAVGAGGTADEARRPALLDLNGVRVAVLAYAGAYWQGTVDMPSSNRIAWGEPAVVADDVRAVRDKADVVVVVLHAGREYSRVPTVSQVAVAHAAVDAGADLVVGHHPHVTQTVERYGRGLIVYSLGDALFDIPLQGAMRGDLLRVQVTRDGLAQAELWPFWIDGEIQPWLLDDGHAVPRFEVIYP